MSSKPASNTGRESNSEAPKVSEALLIEEFKNLTKVRYSLISVNRIMALGAFFFLITVAPLKSPNLVLIAMTLFCFIWFIELFIINKRTQIIRATVRHYEAGKIAREWEDDMIRLDYYKNTFIFEKAIRLILYLEPYFWFMLFFFALYFKRMA